MTYRESQGYDHRAIVVVEAHDAAWDVFAGAVVAVEDVVVDVVAEQFGQQKPSQLQLPMKQLDR